MHYFDYINKPAELLTPEIVGLLCELRECKGRQDLFVEAQPDILNQLLEVAKIQSTGASNRIEGIFTTDKRLAELVREKSEPKNRNEEEIAGYREVLTTIHESYEYISPRPNTILQLHKNLYAFCRINIGGEFKNTDNVIAETGPDGQQRVRFRPVPAFLTADAVGQLCNAYNEAIEVGRHDPLLLTCVFVLDFLCIHPFSDGNGRVSRLLTLLLLYRAGFIVGKYISIEMLIEKSKESYYEALGLSSEGWHDNQNTAMPFVRYMLGILVKSYNEFEKRVERFHRVNMSKSDRIKDIISRHIGKITKSEIMTLAPDVSKATIEKTLADLLDQGYIEKVGKARATGYILK